MLTRLKVSGFKNLVDVDVRFGPFTCIAGANGVGKSNLFDAITFLSALASVPLIKAARTVRSEKVGKGDIRTLFHRVGDAYANQMSFDVEMIIPSEGEDELGQSVETMTTFLRYSIILSYQAKSPSNDRESLEIVKEELVSINATNSDNNLLFDHDSRWRESVIKEGQNRQFISTAAEGGYIQYHSYDPDGKAVKLLPFKLPRTVLSAIDAFDSPTVLLARREMQSWRLLQLEPSALRKPAEFFDPTKLGADGSYLAATLHRLAQNDERVYGQLANRLAELIDDVRSVWVDSDDQRELLSLYVTDHDGTPHLARALSDGTLRFLALAALELDPETQGLLCLEEPENGIHPGRVPAMLALLQDIATNVYEPVDADNPLRQIIVNTHSPAVVGEVPDDSLLYANLKETIRSDRRFKRVSYSCLPDTWRQKVPEGVSLISKGELLAYLNPIRPDSSELRTDGYATGGIRRVADREDIQPMLPYFGRQNE